MQDIDFIPLNVLFKNWRRRRWIWQSSWYKFCEKFKESLIVDIKLNYTEENYTLIMTQCECGGETFSITVQLDS